VLYWFESYLRVRRPNLPLLPCMVTCANPQGSILGPKLFKMYSPDLMRIIERRGLLPHLVANDTQVYGCCSVEWTTYSLWTVFRRVLMKFWIGCGQIDSNSQRRRDWINLAFNLILYFRLFRLWSRLWVHLTISSSVRDLGAWCLQSTSTLICRWEPTLWRQLRAASLHSVRFVHI